MKKIHVLKFQDFPQCKYGSVDDTARGILFCQKPNYWRVLDIACKDTLAQFRWDVFGSKYSVYLIPRKWLDRLGSFSGITGKLTFKGEKEEFFSWVFFFETFNLLSGFIFFEIKVPFILSSNQQSGIKELVTQDQNMHKNTIFRIVITL